MSLKHVEIYTDGACSGNPGPGGWGALMVYGDEEREISEGAFDTTNNRMELTAPIMALKQLKHTCRVTIHTDSTYVKDGITKWIHAWKAKGWKTANKKPVKNRELWEELDELVSQHEVSWEWIKGHSGHPENERADELARQGMVIYKGDF